MEDFVTRVERDVTTAITDLQDIKVLLQNGQPIREPLTKVRRELASLEMDVIDKSR